MSKVTDYLDRLEARVTEPEENFWTREQVNDWANRYWEIRHDKTLTDEDRKAKLRAHDAEYKPQRNVHVNDRGNTVIRDHLDAERYLFDFDSDMLSQGWKQYDTDQDAWYFGVWVNPKTFRTLSYTEGDVTLVVCPDAEHYNAEIRDANEFYREGFIAIAIDADGTSTKYVQDRNEFFAAV